MSYTSSFLKKINHREEAPPDAYIIYDINGGIFWVNGKDFPNFTIEWIGIPKPPPYTVDLSSVGAHAVILDFDYYPNHEEVGISIFNIIETILKMTFLPSVENFTYIIALRPHHTGIHIHLPEFKIGYDDYILLCESLQYKFRQALLGNNVYKLDILSNAMLPGASKPDKKPYTPLRLVYVDERNTFHLNLIKFSQDYNDLKKKFVKRKNNENSLFRSLLNLNSLKMMLGELKQLMMPVICSRVDAPTHTLLYATSMGKHPNVSSDWKDVAEFIYKKTKEKGYISKCKKLIFDNSNVLKVYHHLKLNACNMIEFTSINHAMDMWYKRFRQTSAFDHSHIPVLFKELHEILQFEHMSLAENPNPIKTIMQFNEGYYFLPVFYALCQHYNMNSVDMVAQLHSLLDTEFHPLLDKIGAIPPKIIQYSITEITINTLHFCANNLYHEQPKTNRDKLKSIVANNQRAILVITTQDQMIELIRNMQERHLPILVLKLKNALKKPARFIWNALSESWQELNGEREIGDHLQNLWSYVKQCYNEYKQSGGLGGPDEEVICQFNVAKVVSAIMSDTAMERKDIQMDTHKWFLRLQDGVLDLLTGHIGGVVPELFLSDRKINLGVPRKEMMVLCNQAPHLEALYNKLIDKSFFLKYLQALFLDHADNLIDALADLLPEATDELMTSMLHFYVNLCKCISFEYELLLYMLDVLASIFVGTNYERKFFVWKGLTRNGKSKLFELMGRVLGGYYHSIQSENLSPGHSASNATPELASTLFSCRMVTTEELEKRIDENRVKQITGNSFVAFRNMYEQNKGGIPTAKLFATTNNYPECKASEAFKDRVVAIPFDAEFVDNAPNKTSLQVEKNTYNKDVYVVEQSYKGCFFILYYHLKNHINPKDGLLHYREEPQCVVEFTQEYLIHADIYVQFKLYMDVQLKPGSQTTMNEVKSAVRQYLKTTKNTSFHETDLFICFEKEFGDLRQTDMKISNNTFSYTSIVEEPSAQKRMKLDQESSLVFYEGVIIKNLKRPNFDD